MNEKLKEALHYEVDEIYPKEDFDKDVIALGDFLFLVGGTVSFNEENLLTMITGNLEEKRNLFNNVLYIEEILKSLYEIVDHKGYKQMGEDDVKLEKLYKEVFNLVPKKMTNGEKFSIHKALIDSDSESLEKDYPNNPFICEFIRLYNFRNKVGHGSRRLACNKNELNSAVEDTCVVLLYLCGKYGSILHEKACFERFRRELKPDWIEKCCSAHEEEVEKIGYVDIRLEPGTRISEFPDSETLKKYRYFKLVGVAGKGKTTALKHINYLLLKKFKENNDVIPVFFELKNLFSVEKCLLHIIEECFDISNDAASSLMESEKLIFLLDGYDEINNDIRRDFANALEKFVQDHKSVKIIMTDRSETNTVLADKFTLLRFCPIGEEDKKTYFEKNCKDKEILNLLLKVPENDSRLSDRLNTPLKLEHFVEIVKQDKKIPSKNDFLTKHLEKLFERERREKKNIDPDVMKEYLKKISSLSGASNKPFKKKQAYSTIKEVNDEYGYKGYDTIQTLELAVSMGILEQVGEESCKFSDPDYLKYYRDLYDEDKED